MVEHMKSVAQELSVEERNLLSVAYKNVIGSIKNFMLLHYTYFTKGGVTPL